MKVVIAHRSGQPRVVELPEPKVARNYVTVRVSHSAMRLPDELAQLESASRSIKQGEDGIPLGSCASGVITEVGPGVKRLKTGIRVAVSGAPYVYHATTLVVPETLAVELPKKVNHEEGAYAGQGAIALHLMRTAQVQIGDLVVIHGADMIGVLLAQVVRAAGANPLLVDESEFRLAKSRSLGLPNCTQPDEEQLLRQVDALSDGDGADAVIHTRPSDSNMFRLSTRLLRVGGAVVLGASIADPVPLDVLRERNLRLLTAWGGGVGAGEEDFDMKGLALPRHLARWTQRENMACYCALLAERKVQISPLVTDRIPLERAHLAFEKAARSRESAMGIVLTV